jgi:hypothetical protein
MLLSFNSIKYHQTYQYTHIEMTHSFCGFNDIVSESVLKSSEHELPSIRYGRPIFGVFPAASLHDSLHMLDLLKYQSNEPVFGGVARELTITSAVF